MDRVAKLWHLLPHDRPAVERFARAMQLPPVLAQLLLNRGLNEPAAARKFLDAPLTGLHPPEWLPGAVEAADRLWQAVQDKKRICVYGDYDVDGITGTAILLQALTLLGGAAEFYVPHRLDEGYGLNAEALRQLAQGGVQVVVTVDCGICSVAEAEAAREAGIELIVTDHHEMNETLPRAAVLVHPRLPGAAYPFAGLSGAGVAFKVAWLLCQKASNGPKVSAALREFLLDAVALATLGLVADVMPLHDENRVFVRHGLARLRNSPTIGLTALLQAAGLAMVPALRAEDVAFKLAPRLNAAGRLGCARLVVELLTGTSPQRAHELAAFLESQNQQRQQTERKIAAQAREILANNSDLAAAPALVLAHEDWHPGVIGIVAGRLAERYARPALLIAVRGETATGSGRSVPGFPLHEALKACGEDLQSHGGHAAAAGFRLLPNHIDTFRHRFCEYAARRFPKGMPPPRLVLDAELPLSALTHGLVRDVDRLEPYGAQNPRPRFLAGDVRVVGEPRKIGAGERHVSFRAKQGGTTLRAVAWGLADRVEELMSAAGQCCLAFTPRINEWNGVRTVEIEVTDFQAGARALLD